MVGGSVPLSYRQRHLIKSMCKTDKYAPEWNNVLVRAQTGTV